MKMNNFIIIDLNLNNCWYLLASYLSDTSISDVINVLYEPNDIAKVPLQLILDTTERVDCCFDLQGLSIAQRNHPMLS
jgi:hypothetical protein